MKKRCKQNISSWQAVRLSWLNEVSKQHTHTHEHTHAHIHMHAQADRLFLECWVPFLCACRYEHETGRESALELLASIFTSFPEVSFQTNKHCTSKLFIEAISVLMLCAPINLGRPFMRKWWTSSIFVFCPFSLEKNWKTHKSVLDMASSNS